MAEALKMEELTAPCGLYCGACPLYKAQSNRALAEKLASALGLPVEKSMCTGCRAQKGHIVLLGEQVCETYDCCVNKKGLDFCYQCPDFPCSKLAPCAHRASEIPHNTKIYNLLLIQKEGVENFAKVADNLWRQYFQGKKVRPGGEPQL
jgi:hypothetical protein